MSGDNRRSLASLKLTRKYHLRFQGHWLALSVLLVTLTIWAFGIALWQARVTGAVDEVTFRNLVWFGLLLWACMLACIYGLTTFTSHRLAGPFLAIIRCCEKIRDGDVQHRLKLRESDQLAELETAFNQMLDRLGSQEEVSS